MLSRSQTLVFAALLVFRIINAHLIRTFFQPDEYFQSLEPAWQWTFGQESGAWITWEWRERLRSSLHPLLFAAAYRIADWTCTALQCSNSSRANALLSTPKLLQAVFAAVMDLYTWRLASKIYGKGQFASTAALALTVLSPWQWYCSVRAFSNSLESTLTVVVLDWFPWGWFLKPDANSSRTLTPPGFSMALIAAAIACILRPTNVMIWAGIGACLVWQGLTYRKISTLLGHAMLSGLAVLAVSGGIDRMFFDQWTFPPLRFLYFNIVQSLAVFYGQNRVDYYFTEGLPLLMTTALPFGIVGLWQGFRQSSSPDVAARTRSVLATTVALSVLALTAISHKEVRFIYPLLPILHVLAAKPTAAFFAPLSPARQKGKLAILFLSVLANICIAGYVTQIHQRGVIDVMHFLRDEQTARLANVPHSPAAPDTTVGFLMPCHSTPWRAYLVHSEIDAWALTCEPPINQTPEQRAEYLDEADVFYADPLTWIEENLQEQACDSAIGRPGSLGRGRPEYLVFFEQLLPVLETALSGSKYRECRRFFNTHWHDDGRRKGDVVVWCMS